MSSFPDKLLISCRQKKKKKKSRKERPSIETNTVLLNVRSEDGEQGNNVETGRKSVFKGLFARMSTGCIFFHFVCCVSSPFLPEFNTFCKQRLTTLPSNYIPRQWTVAMNNRWSGQLVSCRAQKGGKKEHKRISWKNRALKEWTKNYGS